MPTRAQKAAVVEELTAQLQSAPISIVSGYRDLSVTEQQELRARIRGAGATFRVVKNSLAVRAASQVGAPGLGEFLNGQSALTFGGEDVPAAARALRDFAAAHPSVDIRGGVLDGELLNADRVLKLAAIMGREQLNAELVWAINAPIAGIVHALDSLISGLVYALQGRLDQLHEAGAEGGS